MTDQLECPRHGPFDVPQGYYGAFREGEGFDVTCPVYDETTEPHYIAATLKSGHVVPRAT